MSMIDTFIICLISFVVSLFSVTVGGTSLITVPVLILFGMVLKNSVATNMFALIFLSLSGSVGFRKEPKSIDLKMIDISVTLTLWGSIIGANLFLSLDEIILKKIVSVMILVVASLCYLNRNLRLKDKGNDVSKTRFYLGAFLIFILGIYGGFFSGGYITLQSYILVAIFGLNFIQTAFVTKIFNMISSLVACIFFYYCDLIVFSVAIPLAVSMFLGGLIGAKLAVTKGNLWVRRMFIIVSIALAMKLWIFRQ